ncbi:tRNA (adenosine(37)-N6)-threonylcarbamoyltransferase complex dimerization subunit type 1 TsaB [Spirosoma sp. BT702]|uniref:tRNA (Adenosine(37)-N6)-threonylcarbamoyltransferase complex dimerization subunit type 1 TsaB n=1 Tax=Spirosoma profusum TaxID=2771354 RepID=A0A927AS23_9BACT|nr:tRNA (adenosine(37)-N6)-threonylcarbamoyltransferase complex dimerization subunit type 1 TsaB [Spirosoma profusum]MBD2700590.1 tRNA (adenosine(37)-N6)-threonylcarbamoyltransferase complex dimerization subunit type 1 TsaB [Spirosoma profusum]
MSLLLSLDTSTTVCSVALHRDGTLLGSYELFTERTSAAMLTTLINNVVQQTGNELHQLDAIAVAKGPGSYTGLRIGVSTAKGLCFALDKPLVAINTLAAMTEQVRDFFPVDYTLCPMLDARRMEVYCAFYNQQGQELDVTSAQIIDENSFHNWLTSGPVVFFGDGAAKCKHLLDKSPKAMFPDVVVQPSARTVGALATLAFNSGQFEDISTFEPFYLKDFMTTQPRKPVV